jgi:hypothetical protein
MEGSIVRNGLDKMKFTVDHTRRFSRFGGVGIADKFAGSLHVSHVKHEENTVGLLNSTP